jgi:RES domain-containing protein
MAGLKRVHDRAILDALDAIDPKPFEGEVWRVTRKGREALRGSGTHGRWSPNGEFEVLYTSLEREGALAEIGYRLSLEPVWPSRIQHEIHRIEARTARTLHIADLAALQPLGVDIAKYQGFDYEATQAITAAAYFLAFDGLLVPSARSRCANLVLFLERVTEYGHLDVRESQPVDWTAWRKDRKPPASID